MNINDDFPAIPVIKNNELKSAVSSLLSAALSFRSVFLQLADGKEFNNIKSADIEHLLVCDRLLDHWENYIDQDEEISSENPRPHYDRVQDILQEINLVHQLDERDIPREALLPALADYLSVCCLLEGKNQNSGDKLINASIEQLDKWKSDYINGRLDEDFYNAENN